MASALVRVTDVLGSGDGAVMQLKVIYMGADVGSPFDAFIDVPIVGTEQPASIRSLMSQAVSAWPAANGYAFSLPAGNINLPTFQKG